MIKKNILCFLLLFTALCTFNSCEVDHHDELYEFEQRLCTNAWAETYINDIGEDVYHEFSFNLNGTGYDYYEYSIGNIPTGKEEKPFTWIGHLNYSYNIDIRYNTGKLSYMDNVRISGSRMYAVWDNYDIEFKEVW